MGWSCEELDDWGVRIEQIDETKILIYPGVVNSFSLSQEIAKSREQQGNHDPFMVVNLDTLLDRHDMWLRELPNVTPFYAVKANPSPILLRILGSLGVNFDCASRGEIEQVLSMGITPDRIIFANPAKPAAYIKYAKQVNVQLMTVDSKEEIEKIHQLFPEARVLIRLATADTSAMTPLSGKFGADAVTQVPDLLRAALELKLNIAGISFHVGSGCRDPTSFRRALQQVKILVILGKSLGHSMDLIDIGGGFSGGQLNANFQECAQEIRDSLKEKIFVDNKIRVIAEPGRYFCSSPFTLCANVIHATRIHLENGIENGHHHTNAAIYPQMKYYLNDGVFGSFACKFFQYLHSEGRPLHPKPERPVMRSTIFGPTCDTWDKLEENRMLEEMKAGEWIYYQDMGAYSCACASNFNGFHPPKHLHVISEARWKELKPKLG